MLSPVSLWPQRLQPIRLLCPWDSPGKNTRVGSHSLLQGIFLTQGSNSDFPHYRQILYCLSHQGSLVDYTRWSINFWWIQLNVKKFLSCVSVSSLYQITSLWYTLFVLQALNSQKELQHQCQKVTYSFSLSSNYFDFKQGKSYLTLLMVVLSSTIRAATQCFNSTIWPRR